jgi:hypothetical protein
MAMLQVTLLLSVLVCGQEPGRNPNSPLALVEKAVQAAGGLEKLKTPGASHRKVLGEFTQDSYRFTGESYGQSPNRVKITHRPIDGDNLAPRTMVIDGDKGWFHMDGFVFDLDETAMARMERARFADRVAGLVVLLEKKDYKLSHLGEVDVKGKPALGVKVEYTGQPDMHLYFDKQTGLLVKTWQKFLDPETNQDMLHELYYSEYRVWNPVEKEERLVKEAKIPVKGPDLLDYLRKNTPSPDTKNKIQGWIGQLGSPSFKIRVQATAELKKAGPAAIPHLEKVASSTDPEVAGRASECLKFLSQDPKTKLHTAVVRLISVHKPEGANPVLLDFLPWADDDLAREIKSALLVLNDGKGKSPDVLLKALESKHPIVRDAALAALGRDKDAFAKQPGRPLFITGLQSAAKCEMYRDGKLHMVLQTTEVEHFNRLEDSVFARPDPNDP